MAEHFQLDPIVVDLALESLADAHLLVAYTPRAERISRRTAIRKLALSGAGIAVAAPVIRSIVAPSTAMAHSTSRNAHKWEVRLLWGR